MDSQLWLYIMVYEDQVLNNEKQNTNSLTKSHCKLLTQKCANDLGLKTILTVALAVFGKKFNHDVSIQEYIFTNLVYIVAINMSWPQSFESDSSPNIYYITNTSVHIKTTIQATHTMDFPITYLTIRTKATIWVNISWSGRIEFILCYIGVQCMTKLIRQ